MLKARFIESYSKIKLNLKVWRMTLLLFAKFVISPFYSAVISQFYKYQAFVFIFLSICAKNNMTFFEYSFFFRNLIFWTLKQILLKNSFGQNFKPLGYVSISGIFNILSGHATLWGHRFFVGLSSRCRPITYWHWSDIVIWYLFATS